MSKSNYYTNVTTFGDNILVRGIKNGERTRERVKFSPALFVPSTKSPTCKTIYGQPLSAINFPTIGEAKEFVNKYKNVDSFPIYGNQNWEYCYLAEAYPDEIQWNVNDIRVANIDIEVGSENGFPNVETASEEITAITMRIDGGIYAFGCGEYLPAEGVTYIKCSSEIELIQKFIAFWSTDYPDAITGWYIKFFDIPYLVNRIMKLLGEDAVRKLSPWNYFYKRTTTIMGKDHHTYVFSGISTLDYMELYRKFTLQGPTQESYKLDYICSVEIGEKKLSYTEYQSLHRLYKENFQLFMEYNVRDTELVERLDKKLKLLELAFTLAYDSKSNFDDVFMQVRMWDNIVFQYLWKENIIIPDKKTTMKIAYEGAYVKEPILGKHQWVVSFDLTSLYPHLMMQYNISPDTIVQPIDYTEFLRTFLNQNICVETLLNQKVNTEGLKDLNITVTPNAQLFRTSKEGFMPKILTKMFADRQAYKKLMIQAEKELEAAKDASDEVKTEIKNRIARFNNLQAVKKICLNSCYGALGNEWFRFFDVRQAAAITTAGQLSIRWIMNAMNGYMNAIMGTKNKDYVVASDTDSIYLNLAPLVDKIIAKSEKPILQTTKEIVDFIDKGCEDKFQPFINKIYQDLATYTNAYAQKMIMKREKICDHAICIGAKNYIWSVWDSEGVRYSEPKIKAVGLKMIKSNTPEVARKKLKKILDIVVHGKETELQKFVAEFKEEFKDLPVEDIATPTSMKGLEEYNDNKTIYRKGTAIHIKGSLLYNHFLRTRGLDRDYQLIHDGEKVKYIYLKSPNPIKNEVISFPMVLPKELGLHKYVDLSLQFEKTFIAPLKSVLDVVGWTAEYKTNIEGFFD